MKIYIEFIIIFCIVLIILLWALWYKWSTRRLLKKFKKEVSINDKGNTRGIGENNNREVTNTEFGTIPTPISPIGFEQPKGQELFSETTISDVRENSDGSRKNGSRIRRFFSRRKKE